MLIDQGRAFSVKSGQQSNKWKLSMILITIDGHIFRLFLYQANQYGKSGPLIKYYL
jgi:hypothetical protein